MTDQPRHPHWPKVGVISPDPDDYGHDLSRLSFDLTYRRSARPRPIHNDGLGGPDLDDARRAGARSPGTWTDDIQDHGDGDPVRYVLGMAVREAVHEALEWAQLDGRPILDPHGPLETAVQGAVDDLTRVLFGLALNGPDGA